MFDCNQLDAARAKVRAAFPEHDYIHVSIGIYAERFGMELPAPEVRVSVASLADRRDNIAGIGATLDAAIADALRSKADRRETLKRTLVEKRAELAALVAELSAQKGGAQ